MSISGHADPNVFKRYKVRRDAVQAEAAERRNAYLTTQRGTMPSAPPIAKKMTRCEGTTLGHNSPESALRDTERHVQAIGMAECERET